MEENSTALVSVLMALMQRLIMKIEEKLTELLQMQNLEWGKIS